MKKMIVIDLPGVTEDRVPEGLFDNEFGRIVEMVADGFTSGEVIAEDADGDPENTFRGWWSLQTENS